MANIVQAGTTRPYDKNDSIILVNHIPRCGGTTFETILKNSFTHFHHALYPVQWPEIINEINVTPGDIAVSGHAAWGLHEHITDKLNVYYLTILRHPLDIFKSDFKGTFQQSCYYASLEHYLQSFSYNRMVNFLANGSLELAKERLSQTYFLFGIVEYYETSLKIFANHFPIKINEYKVRNVTGSFQLELEKNIIDRIMENNTKDYDLYCWATARFKEIAETRMITPIKNKKEEILKNTDQSSRLKFSEATYQNIEKKQIRKAIDEIKEKRLVQYDPTNFWHNHQHLVALSYLYRQLKDDRELEKVYLQLDELRKDSYKLELAYFYRKSNPGKSKEMLYYLLEKLRGLVTQTVESPMNQFVAQCWQLLGTLLSDNTQWEDALDAYKIAFILTPDETAHIRSYANALYRVGEAGEMNRVLRAGVEKGCIPIDSNYKRMLVYLNEKGKAAEANYLIKNSNASAIIEKLKALETTTISEAITPGDKILIIRTAPFLVLDYLYETLPQQRKISISCLTSPEPLSDHELVKKYLFDKVYHLPAGRFTYATEMEKVEREVLETTFDKIVILMNSLDFADYTEIHKLSNHLKSHHIYCYSFDQLFHGKHRDKLLRWPQ